MNHELHDLKVCGGKGITNRFVVPNFSTKTFVQKSERENLTDERQAARTTFAEKRSSNMEHQHHHEPPPDCFKLEELEAFRSFEGQLLADVNYYLWLNHIEGEATPYRFLYFLELVFDSNDSLLLTSGEDSVAIRTGNANELIQTAETLRQMHGKIGIQRANAGAFPMWQTVIGKPLAGIHLSRNDDGLYLNDALLLDFGVQQILVRLAAKEGLAVGVHES
jgi:hypothetical protein